MTLTNRQSFHGKWNRIIPRRYLVSIMAFFGFFHTYVLRVNMSFAVVAMNSNKSVTDSNGSIINTKESDFNWNSKEQGMVLSSFFYGYITTQILGGFLAPIVGASRLFGVGILVTAVLSLLTPVVAYCGIIPLMVVRVLQGVSQGVLFPAMHELWSHWAPPMERTKLLAISYSGNHIGTFATMGVCGLVAEYLGWPWMFYIFGTTAIVWTLLWFLLISEKPSEDKHISLEEVEYLRTTIGKNKKIRFLDAPWKSILTSMPVWAAIVAHTTQNSGFYTLLTQLPTFLNDVSGWRLDKMGILAAVPYLTMAIVVQVAGLLADTLRDRFKIKTTTVRKLFTCGAYIVQMTFLLLTAHMDSSSAAIACLTVAVGIGGFASYSVNFLDLGPQFASLTLGVSNTVATLPGMISPSITGLIVQNKSATEWHMVFYITSGIYLLGAIFYGVFGSGERQSWAKEKSIVIGST